MDIVVPAFAVDVHGVSPGRALRRRCRENPAMTAGKHLFQALSREVAPDQAGTGQPRRQI
jgi:hypothetical protein